MKAVNGMRRSLEEWRRAVASQATPVDDLRAVTRRKESVMFLEMHDAEPPTLCATARNIDYLYQAEQHVIDTCKEHPELVFWVLFADQGTPVRAWRRNDRDFEVCPVPPGTVADPRSMRAPQ